VGDRSEVTCALLWARVPPSYKGGRVFTDFWNAYQAVIPKEEHQATGKGEGQTCHIERFNNSHRALQQHAASADGAVRQEDALVLQERPDARDLSAPVLTRPQQAHPEKVQQLNVNHYQSLFLVLRVAAYIILRAL